MIEKNLSIIEDELLKITKNFEIYIIDDGSIDSTGKIAKNICKNDEKIRYRYFKNGPSRRENLASSFKEASYDKVLLLDLDLEADIKKIAELTSKINSSFDISIASRYKGIRPKRSIFRYSISIIYNNFLKIYLNSNINDHQCGFKAFKTNIVLDLIKEMGYDKKFVRGWFWDAELLVRAQRKGYTIEEIPVTWVDKGESTFNFKREIKMIPYILAFRFRI